MLQDADNSMREMPLGRRFTKAFVGTYMRRYHGLVLEGAENVPPAGGVIVAANHISNLDPPILGVALKATSPGRPFDASQARTSCW